MVLIMLLLIAAFCVKFWPLTVLAMLALVWLYQVGCRDLRAREAAVERAVAEHERAALLARADRQHAQVMRGDPRGTYGQYPPSP